MDNKQKTQYASNNVKKISSHMIRLGELINLVMAEIPKKGKNAYLPLTDDDKQFVSYFKGTLEICCQDINGNTYDITFKQEPNIKWW